VGILSLDDLVLRAEDQAPTGEPPALTFGDVVRALRRIVGARPIRKSGPPERTPNFPAMA
jgi:hypothetical protein